MLSAALAACAVLVVAMASAEGDPDHVALFAPDSGEWTLRYGAGAVDSFYYGTPGDVPLLGDWDCDGTDTVAMYRGSTGFIYYQNSNRYGVADGEFYFGNPGDIPIAGDWDGDGCDSFGIYRGGTVYLSNELGTRPADNVYFFGIPGDRPFAGDFDGDGVATVGLYRRETGLVYFSNSIPADEAPAPTDDEFFYGIPSDEIVVGDWDGDGDETVGIYRPSEGRFYLSFENDQRPADVVISVGRSPSLPVAGNLGSPPSPPPSTSTTTIPSNTTTTIPSNTTTTLPSTSTSTTTTTVPPTTTTFPPQPGVAECLDRPSQTVLEGVYTERVRISEPPDDHTVDARGGVSLTSGQRALEVGSRRIADGGCFIGWTTIGQQSRTLTWRQMHDDITGSALRVYGSNYVVDGLRADNVEDAFDPRGGEGFEVRNMWTEYVRDDCIENDERREGAVLDSLFDGCYTFFSEQDEGEVDGETLIFDRVLVRLQPMPGPHGTDDPAILGHGSFFKKFDDGNRHEPIIRDSIFFLEEDCYSGCKDWPAGTVATNVTIVWVGDGEFPMSVLPGMTLTTDRSIWDSAVADWKQRHGCTTIDQPCTRLHDPLP